MQQKDTQTKKSAAEYLKEPYSRVLIPEEDGGYSAELQEFPGCVSQGDSADEALANLDLAAMNWIEETIKHGNPIPPPSISYGYSGKVALRLPKSLHRKAVEMAERDKVSLNTFLVEAVAARISGADLSSKIISSLDQRLANLNSRMLPLTIMWDSMLDRVFQVQSEQQTPNTKSTFPIFFSAIEGLEVKSTRG